MTKEKDLVNFFGLMENITQVNGLMGRKMETDIGIQIKVKPIWDNGEMGK